MDAPGFAIEPLSRLGSRPTGASPAAPEFSRTKIHAVAAFVPSPPACRPYPASLTMQAMIRIVRLTFLFGKKESSFLIIFACLHFSCALRRRRITPGYRETRPLQAVRLRS
jgi:hypothetical protein